MSTNRDGLDSAECEELARAIIELAASRGCPVGQSPVYFFADEIERLRAALSDADKGMAEIAKNDEEGEFTLDYRATRAAEIAHIWRVRHGLPV